MAMSNESLSDAARRLGRVTMESKSTKSCSCPICREEVSGRPAIHLPCGHSLHHQCHTRLCQSHCQSREKCPVCRASFLEALPWERREQMEAGRTMLMMESMMDVLSDDEYGDDDEPTTEPMSDGLVWHAGAAARRIQDRALARGITPSEGAWQLALRLVLRRDQIREQRLHRVYARRVDEAFRAEEESRRGMGLAELFGEVSPGTPSGDADREPLVDAVASDRDTLDGIEALTWFDPLELAAWWSDNGAR